MRRTWLSTVFRGPRARAWAFGITFLVSCAVAAAASAAGKGKVQGRIVAAESGEPIGFADVALLPYDSTLARVGGMTNADGTFLLEAMPGRYAMQVRALSYASKRIEGLVIEEGKLVPVSASLASEAIQQQEVVVEATARRSTEASMLAVRKKAMSVGDAVSAEQVRKSPDKDAAEVLRRVTGLSVSDGKYVFVRGLGERYSSTEVDGVRIASPEQNKRVVPLDMLPANLLENIVVQKTYTADRPGEFGGGDVQVRTRDFPGAATWSFTVLQGYSENVTFQGRRTYPVDGAGMFGWGADARKIPDEVYQVAGDRPLVLSSNPERGFSASTLASVAKSFTNVWSPTSSYTHPNAGFSATYGNEFKLFGHALGLIGSGTLSRAYDRHDESQRLFAAGTDTVYDYAVTQDRSTVQLGAISGLSYRISPRHTVHLRGLYTNNAEDEVRTYEGPDHNRVEATTGTWLVHRSTRLMYTERSVASATLEGQHEFRQLLGTSFNWKFTRSRARRLQPDRRETIYDHGYYYDGNGELVDYWGLGSVGSREYGDLSDEGWGTTASGSLPVRLGKWGSGKVVLGYDRQSKERDNFYRRFNLYPSANADITGSPETVFSAPGFDGGPGTGYVDEGTLDIDNYHASQWVNAGFLSMDVPFGARVRGNFGVRVEHGFQDVRSFDLFDPSRVTQEGTLDNTDWLPSGNLTWAVTPIVNLRLGASRTLSRPDLNELSPSPSLDYVGGLRVSGNPDLERALIDNYDVRLEGFPSMTGVFAAGCFYKSLHHPIEQVIQGGAPPLLVPRNSAEGRNLGVELEARSGLEKIWRRLNRLSVNANASFISSNVKLAPQLTELGTTEHPLQGQADYLVNVGLNWVSASHRTDFSVLLGAVGKRLRTLGLHPLPDIYQEPTTSLDATLNVTPFANTRVKFSARNLLDPRIQQLQGGKEVSGYRSGRGYAISLVYGS